MNNISSRLKGRFAKDCNVPIKLYDEPYFGNRIKLFDKYFGTVSKWDAFTNMLQKYPNEEAYLAEYNRVKDNAIAYIKGTAAYERFNSMDMNQLAVKNKNLPGKDIYHQRNIGRIFVSIDMRKANFNSMRHFDSDMFGGATSWEDFMRMFTDNEHIVSSKYIREVILGNCNPKRHITYEKHLMDELLSQLIGCGLQLDNVVFFSNDEIIVDVTEYTIDDADKDGLYIAINMAPVPFKTERFQLKGIRRTDTGAVIGYVRVLDDGAMDFKCLNSLTFPFVLRNLNGEAPADEDLVFEHEGCLAKFLQPITVEIFDDINSAV